MSRTPAVHMSDHRCRNLSPRFSAFNPSASVSPMIIPRSQMAAPPPLPPPIHLPDIGAGCDPGWQWGNDPHGNDFGRSASVKSGSSLLGSAASPAKYPFDREHDLASRSIHDRRRNSSIPTVVSVRDVEMSDDYSPPSDDAAHPAKALSNYRLQGERQLEQRTLEESSNSYDKHLLSRIGGPSGNDVPKRLSVSFSPGSVHDSPGHSRYETERRNLSLRPLVLPDLPSSSDSPVSTRWPLSETSPGSMGPSSEHGSLESSRMQTRNCSLTFDDSASSHRGSYDHSMFDVEDGQMGVLNPHERMPRSDEFYSNLKAGTKRRACSPPGEATREERSSVGSASGQSGENASRKPIQPFSSKGSPVSKLSASHSSASSVSSLGQRFGSSLASSVGIGSLASSATSYGSSRLSPSFETEFRPATSQFPLKAHSSNVLSSALYHQIPQDAVLAISQKAQSEKMQHTCGPTGMSQISVVYICECCPKKPKKFDSEGELRQHEAEKQYTCAYCPNRFKNKNEAERHQNSLHLRRHSWSCTALSGPQAAFHPSQSGSGADVCGYCGEEFPNPAQWDVRAEHLNHVHKFGECNQGKKFFRADHFRQHLKHSHAGTSGKWTNLLENACMKDEPLPEPTHGHSAANGSGSGLVIAPSSRLPTLRPPILLETPHDTS